MSVTWQRPFVAGRQHFVRSDGESPLQHLTRVAALNRIHALSCIFAARHGWLGGSWSCCELLTAAYFELGLTDVVLSKGHAAAMQYACLYGLGMIDGQHLLSYKDGPTGLQAHTDRRTPGILVDTGSLGQALSKTAGMAHQQPERHFVAVLGDGELQEGQCFEAFQTVVHHGLHNLTVVVDVNGYQTALPVARIKGIPNRRQLLEGFGFLVREIDGHDLAQVCRALQAAEPGAAPLLVLASTRKAGGSRLLESDCPRGAGPPGAAAPVCRWHGEVPDPPLYLELLREQVGRAGSAALQAELQQWLSEAGEPGAPAADAAVRVAGALRQAGEQAADRLERSAPGPARAPAGPPEGEPGLAVTSPLLDEKTGSTGQLFTEELAALAGPHPELVMLDADLAAPCGAARFAEVGGTVVELGISEQDMVSFAGGMALAGRLPVACTYATFFKRAYEQIFVNQVEGSRVLYAGHYAGLCYFTDGKTHQSLTDLAMMSSLPGMVLFDPIDRRQVRAGLRWAVEEADASVYFRLRRTAAQPALQQALGRLGDELVVDRSGPLVLAGEPPWERCLLATGTVGAALALRCLQHPRMKDVGVLVQWTYSDPQGPVRERYAELLRGVERLVTLEDSLGEGLLLPTVRGLVGELGLPLHVAGLTCRQPGPSFRTLRDCLTYHGFTASRVLELLESDGRIC